MKFVCERCPDYEGQNGNGSLAYHNWIRHLTTYNHQREVRKLIPRHKWPGENGANTYILTGFPNPSGGSWTKLDLAEWISQFGVLSEIYLDLKYNFCIFTILGCGKEGLMKLCSVKNQVEFRGHRILVRSKCTLDNVAWNLVYTKPNLNADVVPAQADSKKPGSTSDSSFQQATSFTSSLHCLQNQSSTTYQNSKLPNGSCNSTDGAKSSENSGRKSSQDVSRNEFNANSGELPSIQTSPKKKSKNNKIKKQNPDVENLPSQLPQSKSNIVSVQSLNRVVKSESVESEQESTDDVVQVKVSSDSKSVPGSKNAQENYSDNNSLDFRGGFTRTRPQEQEHCSTSTSSAAQSESLLTELPECTQLTEIDSHESQIMQNPLFKSASTQPTATELPSDRAVLPFLSNTSLSDTPSVAHSFFENSSNLALDQIKPIAVSVKKEVESPKNIAFDSTKAIHVAPPIGNNSPAKELQKATPSVVSDALPRPRNKPKSLRVIVQPPKLQELITPTFASQVPDSVRNKLQLCLESSQKPGSNPFKFSPDSPPFPQYFEFFHNLPLDSSKFKKNELYKKFLSMPLERQMQEFLLALSLPQEEIRLRWQVVQDILHTLRLQHPKCELYAFGSIVTGLGDFMSDIDIYVDLNGETTLASGSVPVKKLTTIQSLDTTNKILKKALCPHTSKRGFSRLVAIKTARVPVLKLTHHSTNIHCDLSFENLLSVQNTKMMKLYFKLDPRVFPFMVLIRYWGKFHDLTGSTQIKNYGLVLLVLVYLVEIKVIPPVALLQKLKADERKAIGMSYNSNLIDGWDASFSDNVHVIARNFRGLPVPASFAYNCTPTLTSMATEFFEWYANTDLSKFVVCTLLGQILPKSLFQPENVGMLPPSLERYRLRISANGVNQKLSLNTPLCIQDPFVLSFNVGGVTQIKTMVRFQLACAKTYQSLKSSKDMSLLDLLIPLPPHIKEKKFMKTFNQEVQTDELRKEIKLALDEEIGPVLVKKGNKYVNLPPHLECFSAFIDEGPFKAAFKKPKWQRYMEFCLSKDFETHFMTIVSGIEDGKKQKPNSAKLSEWKGKMNDLWVQFATDYLNEFFEQGLKLSIVKKLVLQQSTNVSPTEKRKKVKQEKLIKLASDNISSSVVPTADHLQDKLSNIDPINSQTLYYSVVVNVNYPFWGKKKATKEEEEVLTAVNKDDKKAPPTTVTLKKKGKKSKKINEEKSLPIVNPIIAARTNSEELLKSFSQEPNGSFGAFEIKVLIKLKLIMRHIMDRPKIFFMFEKGPNMKGSDNDNMIRALFHISNMIGDGFYPYQLCRLDEWHKA